MSARPFGLATPRPIFAALTALALCAGCFTKEAPREAPPPAHEPSVAPPVSASPAPESPSPPPPSPPPPGESDGDFDFGMGPAARTPVKPGAKPEQQRQPLDDKKPKSDARPRKAAPAPKAAAESKRELESGSDVARANALMEQLRSTRSVPAADCPGARAQRDTICALAERICRLVDRDPNVASIADYCSEARQRCVDAGRRTAERCD